MEPKKHRIDRAEIERIQGLGETELDSLPFGAIRLDKDGNVLRYNQTEADLVGRRKESVIGKNFFTDVAPCTNVQEFAGRFREGVQKRSLHTVFPFIFDLATGALNVWVTLFYNDENDSSWVFIHAAPRKRK
ncbi:MAG TPA: PAS domain-containing protein [Thermoanaerobaculia bacterium]|nr:PAS domain-containing protein [Thermoanaerobaculia bacterium]